MKKSSYLPQRIDRFWRILAWWCVLAPPTPTASKISRISKYKMAADIMLKIKNCKMSKTVNQIQDN